MNGEIDEVLCVDTSVLSTVLFVRLLFADCRKEEKATDKDCCMSTQYDLGRFGVFEYGLRVRVFVRALLDFICILSM